MSRSPHTFLVAFSVRPDANELDTREQAQTQLLDELSKITIEGVNNVECWWEADDDRQSNADENSAVFIYPGLQARASEILAAMGMTSERNVVRDRPTRFNGEPI